MAHSKKAFSLLEMLLVIVLIGILSGIMAPVAVRLFHRNNVDVSTEQIKTILYRAKILALSSENDSNWGVYISSTTITLFSGNSYLSRNINLDEVDNVNKNVNINGLTEIVFNKSVAESSATGTIFINQENEYSEIIIADKGLIY